MIPTPQTQIIGYGLMGLSFVLPLLVGSTDKNTEATKANTEANGEVIASQERLRLSFMANVDENGRSGLVRALFKNNVGEHGAVDWQLKNNLESYKQHPSNWGDKPYYDYSNKDRVDVYLHGTINESVMRAKMNQAINASIPID